MSELREGLAKHLYGVIPFGDCTRNDAEALADSVLAYLHAHDGHAEFVRAAKDDAIAAEGYLSLDGRMRNWAAFMAAQRIIALCDAELAKEMSNG